ncbi:aquaporin-3-like [Salmo trutta]|uniref:aquaporin-3-like n=1 Tax=Salmo trutta TaxID=8032 RepID=UPI001131D852|nr:aquaporin-3-like [Salmo trutta]
MGKQKALMDKLVRTFQIRHMLLRQALAECLGTLILVMFGCGAVAQLVLSGGSHGMVLIVNFAFCFTATLGIGGHLNPAVTFTLCLLGREPLRTFPVLFLFRTLGAFLGSWIIFGMYFDALWDNGKGTLIVVGENATTGIFATYPSKHLTLVNGFFDQHGIAMPARLQTPGNRVVVGVHDGQDTHDQGSRAFNSGYAVNPARDLGPCIFTALAGWGSEVFTAYFYWFFVPIFAPFIGAVVGMMVYQLMLGYHVEGKAREKREEEEKEEQEEMLKLSSLSTKESA